MKKLILALFLGCALILSGTQADAFSLASTGPVQFVINGLSESLDTTAAALTTTEAKDAGIISASEKTAADTWATSGNPLAGAGETWGIFRVSEIINPNTSAQLWDSGDAGEYMYGIFYGLFDHSIVANSATDFTIDQLGGAFSIYLSPHAVPTGFDITEGPEGRIGNDGYKSISDLAGVSKALTGLFNPSVVIGDAVTSVRQDVDAATAPANGSGAGYADITGGTLAGLFDSNLELDAAGAPHDFFFSFDVDDPTAFQAAEGWDQEITTGSIVGNAIPEPTTMLLFGTGLVGAIMRRRKA